VRDVVILSLGEHRPAQGGGCGDAGAGACCSGAGATPRVPVLTCADALRSRGARAEIVTACADSEIDAAVKPLMSGDAALIIAAASDGEVRAVLRRLVRLYAPAPSKRPDGLAADRTMPDLPPVGLLPLAPAVPDLVGALGLPTEPDVVAAAVLGGRSRRLDLLRNDGGSVTLHGSVLGGVDSPGGVAVPWFGRVEVDDKVLTDGSEQVLACALSNVGAVEVDGLPLITEAAPDDGRIAVAVAVPVRVRRPLRAPSVRLEVRRASGRAVAVIPRGNEVPLLDDGVAGSLTRKRSWWSERSGWAAYVP
jgi:hypothetical protein